MTSFRQLAAFIAFALLMHGAIAQVESSPSVAASSAASAAVAPEVIALRAQTATMQAYQDRFVAIVTWALSTVTGFIALLLGLNWWSGVRSSERDREAMRRELQGEIKTALATAKGTLSAAVDSRVENAVKRSMKRLDNSVCRLELSALKTERTMWLDKGVIGNALTTSLEMVELANSSAAPSYMIQDALDLLTEDVRSLEKDRRPAGVMAYDISKAAVCLAAVPADQKHFASDLLQRIVALTKAPIAS